MRDPVKIVLVGAGGYGGYYLAPLLSQEETRGFRLVGVIDPDPEKCNYLSELRARKIPFFARLEEFFARDGCDLAILSSPIHHHCEQTCLALAHGSHVLCEKPLCATREQIDRMQSAEKASGKTVTIGYQWAFSTSIQRLKADSLAGRFGQPLRFRTMVGWPRDEAYYRRNHWAGRIHTPDGEPVLDSPVNNATAHHLHNMLYLLGPEVAASAYPRSTEAELWRANPIENYDTAALCVDIGSGVEVLFYTSHAVKEEKGPVFSYEYEEAIVSYTPTQGRMIAQLHGGGAIDYGFPEDLSHEKIWAAVESARSGRPPLCGIAAAAAHTLCVVQAQEAVAGIQDFPSSLICVNRSGSAPRLYVEGLWETMNQCYQEGKLFSEAKAAFTIPLLAPT